MGSNGASGGGNTGADQGFFNSEKAKKEKQNDKNLGTSDYQGSLYSKEKSKTKSFTNTGGGDNNGNQVVQAPIPKVDAAPTTAEVSQVTATQAEDPIELRKRKAKARGRSPTIMTGVTGVTGSLTLGKPSLLGR